MPTNPNDTYTSPLASRNASPEMLRIWSPRHKFNTWRRIWLAVAEAQHEVTKGWDTPLVSQEQVDELRAVVERGITDEELARASEIERDLRHDVMAHVHCLGEQCPKAKAIIHLGCTSQDVVCNADLLVLREALELIERKTYRACLSLAETALQHKNTPTLGFTHYQPAQPTTVGRRLCEYASGIELAGGRFEARDYMKLRGLRGATGTQASFLNLLSGHANAVDELEARFCWAVRESEVDLEADFDEHKAIQLRAARVHLGGQREVGNTERVLAWESRVREIESLTRDDYLRERVTFAQHLVFELTGQTYPRVVDSFILADLASVAAVLHKIATDIRLLSNRKEIDEPFGSKQIGSSAMPYKRNPMKCERICGLTRFVMNLVGNAYDTAATQWLERTLDDSSNRRLSLPEAFLALDGALDLMHQVASGLVVHEAMVRKNLMAELPFLATENILMEAVKAGGDRQELHEKIRVHAQAAGMKVKQEGLDNDLIERLRGDEAFAPVHHLLTEDQMKYGGRSVEQTERFLKEVVEPLRERYGSELESLGASDRGV
ncbi:MAG: adenylosuccinate lyase [Phycisphaerales bacterium]|nr:adenylosuccinate lyase [Phycisphaerales bacterium]